MFVELHLLQNFAPSNLNRDDTGAPKDCEFGGYRRARISSQCLKRAMREYFRTAALLPPTALSSRTKRAAEALGERLEQRGHPADQARAVAVAALKGAGLGIKEGDKTEYLLFLGARELDLVAGLCGDHWDALLAVSAAPAAEEPADGSPAAGRRSAREVKRRAQETVPDELKKGIDLALDGGRAADLALFGRMIADRPARNVDAACQVAHALSTNRVSVDFDFYTAVDDLNPDDTAGAGMLGTVEFNSACFYRYANLDLEQLQRNLQGDQELASQTVDAFIRAAVEAVPTGKQNSMAAHNPPSFVLAVARDRGLWSLANAFCEPVWPGRRDGEGGRENDLVGGSIRALDAYWGKLLKMYGRGGLRGAWACALDGDGLVNLAGNQVDSLEALRAAVQGAVQLGRAAG